MKKAISILSVIVTCVALSHSASAQQTTQATYAKSDFVPGDVIFFEDTFENEKLGEFPSQWDLLEGYSEVASVQGRKVLAFTDDGIGSVIPLMKKKWDWLPDVFTVEYDLYVSKPDSNLDETTSLEYWLCFGERGDGSYYNYTGYVAFRYREDGSCSM